MKKKNENWQPILFAAAVLIALVYLISSVMTEPVSDIIQDNKTISGECITDKDCRVAGCSGQICTTAGAARGIFTTCEWKEEYDCLQYSSCGCNNGRCGWKETTEYNSCLAGLNE